MQDLKKAELVEGIVYVMASPLSLERHGAPHSRINGWLHNYEVDTPGVCAGDNPSVRLDDLNELQPDLVLFIEPDHGGRVYLDPQGFMEQAPELVVEISNMTASLDLHGKLRIYEKYGVREYIVWRTRDQAIDWFINRGGAFQRLMLDPESFYRSEAFPGLWLDPAAMIRRDSRRVRDVLAQGLASPEHARFVHRLRDAAQAPRNP